MISPSTEFDAQRFLQSATTRPGVYRMLGADGKVLYVGKARNLKKRLASYFRASGLPVKTRALASLFWRRASRPPEAKGGSNVKSPLPS